MKSCGCGIANLFAVVSMLCIAPTVNGEDGGDEKAWFRIMAQQAESYAFTTQNRKWEIRKGDEPVFRHDAPSRNSDDVGGVWVWADQHLRPVAVGTVFGWTSGPGTRAVTTEFCSLSRYEFQASWKYRDRIDTWSPRETATWKRIPNASTPSENSRNLKLQMRREARRFAAHTFDPSRKRWELRLLPSPVYEYESTKSELTLGGAVFVICQDTNTDVILAIEAVRDQIDSPYRFEFALGSFTDWDLHVHLDGEEIWTEDSSDSRGKNDLHWVRRTGPIRLPEQPIERAD